MKKFVKFELVLSDVVSIITGVAVGKKVADVTDNKAIGVGAGVGTMLATDYVVRGAVARANGMSYNESFKFSEEAAEAEIPVEDSSEEGEVESK